MCLTPKFLTTSVNLIGCTLCFHRPDINGTDTYPNVSRIDTNLSCMIRPGCRIPYIPFIISVYTYMLCDYLPRSYLRQNLSGVFLA